MQNIEGVRKTRLRLFMYDKHGFNSRPISIKSMHTYKKSNYSLDINEQ